MLATANTVSTVTSMSMTNGCRRRIFRQLLPAITRVVVAARGTSRGIQSF